MARGEFVREVLIACQDRLQQLLMGPLVAFPELQPGDRPPELAAGHRRYRTPHRLEQLVARRPQDRAVKVRALLHRGLLIGGVHHGRGAFELLDLIATTRGRGQRRGRPLQRPHRLQK
ncbi:hypothetical protein KEK_12278 [Mycolicibacterium thermoresistibile ATCC 19527]|uniref:Uncharacterized protein n=1 Tax=Mycolicibacterium thermoresistibile (strain ATCC 19527 / DSM 44167 / CIP 105390 / JCM 6362 / NCTC 10409 / 316) TaxID=1078020 RepID=G7CKG3_MYCT3|nr:hypothetical protein KEK_12278 [Mycolicibacterium thermoresistibile ATCC 19527]